MELFDRKATQPEQGNFNFTDCDLVYYTAMSFNQSFRGHNLCWGVHNPDWYGLAWVGHVIALSIS